jgi:hypothetical protein
LPPPLFLPSRIFPDQILDLGIARLPTESFWAFYLYLCPFLSSSFTQKTEIAPFPNKHFPHYFRLFTWPFLPTASSPFYNLGCLLLLLMVLR